MATRTVKIDFSNIFNNLVTYDATTGYNVLGYASATFIKSGYKDTAGEATSITTQFSRDVTNTYDQTNVNSDAFGIPGPVWKSNWSWASGTTTNLTIRGLVAGKTVIIDFGSVAFNTNNKITLTIGETSVVYPNTAGSSVIEAPVTITGIADENGELLVVMSDDNANSAYDLAFLHITYSDGIGEEPYPVFSKRFVQDKFDTSFTDTTKTLTVYVIDPLTDAVVHKGATSIQGSGEFRYGHETLSYGKNYLVAVASPARNWFGELTTSL